MFFSIFLNTCEEIYVFYVQLLMCDATILFSLFDQDLTIPDAKR